MSFDHSLYLDLQCKPGTSVNSIFEHIEPMLEDLGMKKEDVQIIGLDDRADDITSGLFIRIDAEGKPIEFVAETSGEITHSFIDTMHAVAEAITPLFEPDNFEIADHSTGDVRNSVTSIWVGQGEDLLICKRTRATARALDALKDLDYTEAQLEAVRVLITQFNLPSDRANRERMRPA